jgi:hypothetical protein
MPALSGNYRSFPQILFADAWRNVKLDLLAEWQSGLATPARV